MHSCLEIGEILELVIEYAFFDEDSNAAPSGARTVAAFALTCRRFLEPALDRLWNTQLTLDPLVKTLPTDAWMVYGKNIVVLVRPLFFTDWSRFKLYASRIKAFGYDPQAITDASRSGAQLNLALLDYYIAHHPKTPLLPRLRRLRWSSYHMTPKLAHYVDLFIVPSLTVLNLDFTYHWRYKEEQGFISVLLANVIWRHCPSLAHLVMDSIPFDKLYNSSALDAWVALRQSVPRLVRDDLIRIGALSYIRELQVWIKSPQDVPALSELPNPCAFATLRILRLHVPSLDAGIAFLQMLTSCELEILAVSAEERPNANLVMQFLSELERTCTSSSLRELRLFDTADFRAIRSFRYITDRAPGLRAQFAVGAQTFSALLAFHNLRVVDINFNVVYELDDAALAQMAAAWPLLENLSIGALHGWNTPSGVTLPGLGQVIKLCPSLRSCGLALDMTLPHTDEGSESPARIANPHITSLHLADTECPEGDGQDVGWALGRLFPNLRELARCRYCGLESREVRFWESVMKEVRAVGEASKQTSPGSDTPLVI